jgi:ABC-type Na+ efflux pump permease subunit
MKRKKIMDRIGLALPKSRLAIVIWRELLDALRDRRTIIAAVVLPMILIPLTLNLPIFFISPKQNPPNIAIAQLDPSPLAGSLFDAMNSTDSLKITRISGSENLTDLVSSNAYDLVVLIPSNFTQLILLNGTAPLQVIYDSSNQRSTTGLNIVQAVEGQFSAAIVVQRLSKLNIDPSLLNPVKLTASSVTAVSPSQAIAGLLVPYFIGILSIMAGVSFATDTTAGEKERRTLEVFLTMPLTRGQIILGKYLGVFMLSLIGIFCQIVGVMIGFNVYASLMSEIIGQGSQGLGLSLVNLLAMAPFALILSMTGNAIVMAVSIFAKSYKEAQQYTSALTTALILPLLVVMYLPPATLSQMVFLPILGPVIVLRDIVFNIWTVDKIVISLISSIVFLVITLYLASVLFSREKVLFRV